MALFGERYNMKNFKISEEDAQKILEYLGSCQYQQVYQLVQILMNLEEIKKDNKQELNDLS